MYRLALPFLAAFAPIAACAQTAESQADLDGRLAALRTAAPFVAPSGAAIAADELAVAALAARIDRRLDTFWQKNNIKPAEPASDAEFLRRLSLDLVGRIPGSHEVRVFVADPDPRKRDKKVVEMLRRPGHFQHFSVVLRQQWVPQLANNSRLERTEPQFEAWVRRRLQKNVGLDQVVGEMLTAPTLFARQDGALIDQQVLDTTAFVFNQANEFKPESVAASASRLFMGVKMECAQCHDHPFAPITRDQFWETAAFFAELQPVVANLDDDRLKREIRIQDPDPKKVKKVQARFPDDSEPKWEKGVSPRRIFVNWLTAPQNPYFARNAVERAWAHFFGIGFIDPIDEPSPDNAEIIPELVDDMAREFIASKYDSRFMIRVITRTRAYQLSSVQGDPSQANIRHFARMNVKALTPEQLFDSLVQATGFDENAQRQQQPQAFERSPRQMFLSKFASTEKITERQTSILQALTLMNGKFINDQTSLEKSHYLAAVVDAPFMSPEARIEALFLAALSRFPTAAESANFTSHALRSGSADDVKKAYTDVFWALLNSSEFILNH